MTVKTKPQINELFYQGSFDDLLKQCRTYGSIVSRDNWYSEEGDRYDGEWSLIRVLYQNYVWSFELHNGEVVECTRFYN